ncbi:MAG TPA: hypothetical protein VGL35_13430 [Rhizomicrobium sp.]|jgi:hypothetical protein
MVAISGELGSYGRWMTVVVHESIGIHGIGIAGPSPLDRYCARFDSLGVRMILLPSMPMQIPMVLILTLSKDATCSCNLR